MPWKRLVQRNIECVQSPRGLHKLGARNNIQTEVIKDFVISSAARNLIFAATFKSRFFVWDDTTTQYQTESDGLEIPF
jgi:hypothetical protein